jgi:predicted AAA+ superfamily ATPase
MYQRILQDQLQKDFFSGKVIMLLGARQIGKTTLVEEILKQYPPEEIVAFNGDNNRHRELLSENNLDQS